MVAEQIEELPAEFLNFFQSKRVSENILRRLNETLRSAVPFLQYEELDPTAEGWQIHLYNVMFKLRELGDTIGNQDVTKPQCRKLEKIIGEIQGHLATFDDRKKYEAANPISSPRNFGQWEKKQRIGAGRFGIVFVCLNSKTEELCAMKEMLDIDDLATAKSLQQEIDILRGLEHPNIVKYYGSRREESQISIYMEYVQPGSLKKYISVRGALQESLVRDFTAQILSGLVYLHGQRVVHRDIKADNLLVDSHGNVKLADFGLAKKLAEAVGNHSRFGTPYYAAPEVIRKEKYNGSGEASAADIWSLGCVIIEMFTGKHPWPDHEPEQVIYKVGSGKTKPAIPKDLSLAGQWFLERCFRRNPARRLSAAALLNHPFVKAQTS